MSEAKQFTTDEAIAIVNAIMVEDFEVVVEELKREAPLQELGLDSLDGVDLVVAIEKAFSTRIPEQEARNIRTLGDIYDRVLHQADVEKSA